MSGPAVRQIWDAIYGLQGQKAALPGGNLPALPHINAAGQIVQTTAATIALPQPATEPRRGGVGAAAR